MKIFVPLLLAIVIRSYIIETESLPQQKTCVSEMFKKGEPISVRAKATNPPKNRYGLYITIENESKVLLAHKRHEFKSNDSLLTYNNEVDQDLYICIDNFETFPIDVELDIKFRHHLANLDTSPTLSDYKEIEEGLSDINELVQRGYSYFIKNESYVDEIVRQGTTLENTLTIVGVVTLGFILGTGLLEIALIMTDLKNKKIF